MNACRWSSWLLTIGLFLSVNSYSQGVIATYAGRDRAFPADGQLGVPFDASYAKHAADVAAIYRVGLRAVTGGVPAGSISLSSPPAATGNSVTLTIGIGAKRRIFQLDWI